MNICFTIPIFDEDEEEQQNKTRKRSNAPEQSSHNALATKRRKLGEEEDVQTAQEVGEKGEEAEEEEEKRSIQLVLTADKRKSGRSPETRAEKEDALKQKLIAFALNVLSLIHPPFDYRTSEIYALVKKEFPNFAKPVVSSCLALFDKYHTNVSRFCASIPIAHWQSFLFVNLSVRMFYSSLLIL